jgi:hypothetical protein
MIITIKLHATSNASSRDVDSLSSLAEEMEYTVYTLRLDEGHGFGAAALPVGTATRAKCATTETVLKGVLMLNCTHFHASGFPLRHYRPTSNNGASSICFVEDHFPCPDTLFAAAAVRFHHRVHTPFYPPRIATQARKGYISLVEKKPTAC